MFVYVIIYILINLLSSLVLEIKEQLMVESMLFYYSSLVIYFLNILDIFKSICGTQQNSERMWQELNKLRVCGLNYKYLYMNTRTYHIFLPN